MKRFFLSALLVLSFAACDSDEPGDTPALGTFEAEVQFDDGEHLDLSGSASALLLSPVFIVRDSLTVTSSRGFSLSLIGLAPETAADEPLVPVISFTRFGGDRPPPGVYPLGRSDSTDFTASFATVDRISFGNGSAVAAASGTLTISRSDEERIAGSFRFEGTHTPVEEPVRRAVVSGTFDASIRDLGEFGDGSGGFTPLFP